MKNIYNDVFRLVNLRGSRDGLSIDPDSDTDLGDVDGPVIRRIRDAAFNVDDPANEALAAELANTASAARSSTLAELTRYLSAQPDATRSSKASYGGQQLELGQLAASVSFQRDVANAYNAWLFAKLWKSYGAHLREFEDQVRVGHWVHVEGAKRAGAPVTPFLSSSSRQMHVSLPRSLREKLTEHRAAKRLASLVRRQAPTADASVEVTHGFASSEEKIKQYGSVAKQLHDSVLARLTRDPTPSEDEVIRGKSKVGFLRRVADFIFGRPAKRASVARSSDSIGVVDAALVADLKAGLSADEAKLVDELLTDLGAQPTVESTIAALAVATNDAIAVANEIYSELLLAQKYAKTTLPEPSAIAAIVTQGAVQPLGWGDLIVATEKLIDYEANEIAHIENILPNERKNRDHTRSTTIEDTFETETEETEESERELETTSRHELQVQSSKSIAEDFSIQTGVNTSGRYGLTKVETSLDAAFGRSQQEAQSATTNIAKEIVARALERTFKSVRELRRRTVTTEVVELNRHEINNVPAAGGAAPSISGIYKWVEKVHELQLRHYGTRMMVEFSVPEPGLSIVGRQDDIDVDVAEPTPPSFNAAGVTEAKYLAYAKLYDAVGVTPPPDRFISVGFAWKSQPNERDNEDKSEDVLGELIAIPEQYRPTLGRFRLSAHPKDEDEFQVRLQIADQQFSKDGDAIFGKWFNLTTSSAEVSWPGGVPISMTAHGHFDKTLSMNVVLTCVLRDAAFRQWQIKTFEAIQRGYERQLQTYNEAVEAARLKSAVQVASAVGPDALNRRTEREELQKWSIKILRREPIDLDAVVKIGTGLKAHNEIDPGAADQQAPIVRFYEEAFEWDNISYFFYPYFWGRRDAWTVRQDLRHPDHRFEAFLRAGAARVIVPITPGYEAKVLFYLANADVPENERIAGPPDPESSELPESVADSVYDTMWLELMLDRNEALTRGSGFLSVVKNSAEVKNVESTWEATDRDIGRELFIAGDRYEVAAVTSPTTIELTAPYSGADDPRAPYATGSVAFGPPWVVNLPTQLVVLNENKDDVSLR